MKLYTGWVMSAGLVLSAAAANAQMLAPYERGRSPVKVVSDVGGPYAAMPPDAPIPRYPGYGPRLLPPQEVYTVVRESGFSPLGIPQQRGLIYTISVIDRGGDDGRLVIDARTGRILRFVRASRMGDNFNDELTVNYGPVGPLPPPPAATLRGPSPSASAPPPRLASRTPSVPLPKPAPHDAGAPKPQATVPLPALPQQSAAVQAKPAAIAPQAAAPAVIAPPQVQPTQDMPKVQGLE